MAQRSPEARRRTGGVHDEREGRESTKLLRLMGGQAQLLGMLAHAGTAVDKMDILHAQGSGDESGVERDAGAERGPGSETGEYEHARIGVMLDQIRYVRAHVSIAVGDVVRDTRGDGGLQTIR
jgi:hypothetical protein